MEFYSKSDSHHAVFDNEGQLTSANTTNYTFDYEHRLSAIGTTSQFSYDARGNRLKAVRSGITTYYIYDPRGNLLAEADSAKHITRTYIHGQGLLSVATPTTRYCYHFNAIGSTIALTDMSQTVVNEYAYDPFGTILSEQETFPQPFKFIGQFGVMAESNSLYYMRARYYDTTVGRFVSEDPIGFDGGDVNLYAYVKSNPVNRIDPLGLIYLEDYNELFAPSPLHIYGQTGLQASLMIGYIGVSVSTGPAVSTSGQGCYLVTACVRPGFGFYAGAGVFAGAGVISDNTSNLGKWSVGVGGDVGLIQSVGGGIVAGLPLGGYVGGFKGKYGWGFGANVGVDICYTWLECRPCDN